MKDQKLKEEIQEAIRTISTKYAYEKNGEETRANYKREVEECLERFSKDGKIGQYVVSCSENEQENPDGNELDLSFGIKEPGDEEKPDFSMFSVKVSPSKGELEDLVTD